MRLAFFAVGVGALAVAVGLWTSLTRSKRGIWSALLVGVAGVGFLVAGAFVTDPTGQEELTTSGQLHLVGALLVFPVLVVQSYLTRGASRRDQDWQSFAARIRWFPHLLLAGFLVSFFAPGVPEGLGQRVFAAIIMAWLAVLAWELRTPVAARELSRTADR